MALKVDGRYLAGYFSLYFCGLFIFARSEDAATILECNLKRRWRRPLRAVRSNFKVNNINVGCVTSEARKFFSRAKRAAQSRAIKIRKGQSHKHLPLVVMVVVACASRCTFAIEVKTLSPRSKLSCTHVCELCVGIINTIDSPKPPRSGENKWQKTIVKASREEIPFDCLP